LYLPAQIRIEMTLRASRKISEKWHGEVSLAIHCCTVALGRAEGGLAHCVECAKAMFPCVQYCNDTNISWGLVYIYHIIYKSYII